jgi:hypothetical protein
VLQAYLPARLSADEIAAEVAPSSPSWAPAGPGDMGKVMGAVKAPGRQGRHGCGQRGGQGGAGGLNLNPPVSLAPLAGPPSCCWRALLGWAQADPPARVAYVSALEGAAQLATDGRDLAPAGINWPVTNGTRSLVDPERPHRAAQRLDLPSRLTRSADLSITRARRRHHPAGADGRQPVAARAPAAPGRAGRGRYPAVGRGGPRSRANTASTSTRAATPRG